MSHKIKYRCYGCGVQDICKIKEAAECAVYPANTSFKDVREERDQKPYHNKRQNEKRRELDALKFMADC